MYSWPFSSFVVFVLLLLVHTALASFLVGVVRLDGRSCVLTWMKGPPSTLALRGLVLLTKMLQQLANRQTITEDKGPELCQFNNLLVQSQEPLEAFSHRLVVSLPD